MKSTSKTTFKELYPREKDKPTPAQSFIERIAELTNRSGYTIRQWLSGTQIPDINTQKKIALEYNIPYDCLFPTTNES